MDIKKYRDDVVVRYKQDFVCNDSFIFDMLAEYAECEEVESISELRDLVDDRQYEMFYEVMPYYNQLIDWLNNCEDAITYCDEVLEETYSPGMTMWKLLTIAVAKYCYDRSIRMLDELEDTIGDK